MRWSAPRVLLALAVLVLGCLIGTAPILVARVKARAREARRYTWTFTVEPAGSSPVALECDLRRSDEELSRDMGSAMTPLFNGSPAGVEVGTFRMTHSWNSEAGSRDPILKSMTTTVSIPGGGARVRRSLNGESYDLQFPPSPWDTYVDAAAVKRSSASILLTDARMWQESLQSRETR
jgi:hypothetical protein